MTTIQFVKKYPNAVVPKRAHATDIGYDLTAINIYKKISDTTVLLETGLAVKPPDGYYIEIVPRSSLSKTGYMLSNSVGIIDPSYRGTLKIALTKVDKVADPITFPFNRFQLILRKAEYFELQEVENLDDTERGDGGFGSTDNK